jgi:HD superfamily phosphodiesterase
MNPLAPPLRLAEAAGVLSLATDLAMGQPLEHGLRTAMLALRMAQAMGLSEDDQVTVYYTGLLHFAGCTAESEIDARFFGDEMAARPRMMAVAHGSRLELIATAMRTAHQGSAPLARAAMMTRAAFGGIAEFRKWAASHCDVARILGARMGLSGPVQQSLRHLYERWDGNGMPGELRGTQIPLAVRLMQVAQDADVACQYGGIALASGTLTRRAGSGLDPDAVRIFLSLGDRPYKGLDAPSIWEEAMAGEPGPQPEVAEARLDACLSAVADFADLKSMWTTGHSRGVADLAERAAGVAGLAPSEVATLRRAALVHDIGRVAVPVSVGEAGPAEPRRVMSRCGCTPTTASGCSTPARRCARWPGFGGSTASGATGPDTTGSRAGDRLRRGLALAAADCYQAMRGGGRTARRCRRRQRPTNCPGRRRRAGSRTMRSGRYCPPRASRAGQYPYPGPPDCPSASARCSASSPAAWPPSR